jgi:hypothetical protein
VADLGDLDAVLLAHAHTAFAEPPAPVAAG